MLGVLPDSYPLGHLPMAKMTARSVETIKPGTARREVPDGYLPGLYLIVQPSGAKSWAVRYRHNGTTRKHTIGGYPLFDLKTAREFGRTALRAAAEGRDPGRERQEARRATIDSVEAVAAQFIEHAKQATRATTWRETERILAKEVLPRWRGRLIRDITRRDVLHLLDSIMGRGPVIANQTLKKIKRLFSWCVERDIIAASPCTGVRPPGQERSRERVLSDVETAAVWNAAGKRGYPAGSLTQILMLTAQRRSEVSGMRWSELDLRAGLWKLPSERTKGDRPHEVPLSAQALSVIETIPRIAGSDFVFAGAAGRSVGSFSRMKGQIDALVAIPGWTFHDLRRTAATGMARLGIALPVVEKVLNHAGTSFSGVAGIYQRHNFADEKRKALEAWATHIEGLVKGKSGTKVVRMARP
jgi:integrase